MIDTGRGNNEISSEPSSFEPHNSPEEQDDEQEDQEEQDDEQQEEEEHQHPHQQQQQQQLQHQLQQQQQQQQQQQEAPSKIKNEIGDATTMDNNNNNDNTKVANELIVKQLARVEHHLGTLEVKFRAQDHRLMTIESANQEILLKLNHLLECQATFANQAPTNHQANNAGGSSRHSSASVSPSLGVRSASSNSVSPSLGGHSALSTSAAQSPINQLGAPSNGLNVNQAHQLAAAAAASQQDQSTVAAMAAASQFLSALARSQVGQLDDLDHLTQSQLLGTLNAAAAANSDVATNLSNHLPKQQSINHNNNNNNNNNSSNHNHNNINNNNNNSGLANNLSAAAGQSAHNRGHLTPQTMAQQLAAVAAANSGLNSTSAAAAAAMAAQLSAAGNRSLVGSAGGQPGGPGTGSMVPVVHTMPHPHSHHALSNPTTSLLMNNPHHTPYQTVRTKYSTRRYSRRRVGPDEAMADPNIRLTVQKKLETVKKTILIVLKHRLTVQTAITLACARTGERLRKGAIQKKLEAMFREPGAVERFMIENDTD